MAGPGTQSAPKGTTAQRLEVEKMREALHSMAMLLLHNGDRLALSPDDVRSHLDVVQNVLAGVTREE